MLTLAHADILEQAIVVGLDDNILRVCQAIFPHEVTVSNAVFQGDMDMMAPNEWCHDQMGGPVFIDQFLTKRRVFTRSGLWGAFGARYFFFQQDQAFHFKMIFG